MKPVLLFRASLAEEDELNCAKQYFAVIERRSLIPSDRLIIPRYSSLPYYDELDKDVQFAMSELINTPVQHEYVANIANWYKDLEDLTPKTYFSGFSSLPSGSYVLKGATNSRKHEWNRRMFAPTNHDIPKIMGSLLDDCLIKDQGIVVREFEKFQTYEYGINDLPITHEYRVFVCDSKIVSFGYYWASHPEIYESPNFHHDFIDGRGMDLVGRVIERIGNKCRFYVIDIARKEDGEWRVIELNDATMSGLSTISPANFYANLERILG